MANKKDVITSMAEKSGLTKKESEVALKAFIESVEEALAKGEKVQLVGFGTFETRERKGRTGILQMGERKGETYTTEDKMVPVFKAGKEFKNKIAGK